jgi:hypothetical protein
MQGGSDTGRETRPPTVRRVIRRPVLPPRPEGGDEAEPARLLRPAAACPRCGARPAIRITAAMVSALRGHDDGTRLGTYQCQRRGCGAIYDICASAYLRAS